MALRRSLTTLTLVFVMYFNISGGAFTMEGLVAGVGPGMALLILLLVPLLWSLPETLIIGELASMLPVEGGYYRWVQRAFGEFWAFQNGWITWLYSLVDMAIYPVLFNQYLAFLVPDLSPGAQWAVSLAVIWGATAVNLRGALPVGRVSTVAGIVVLAGFGGLALLALPNAAHVPWHPFLKEGEGVATGLSVGLSTALWNYIGWDNASTAGDEIKDSSRTYPRALAITLPLVALGYFVPLLPSLAATDWTTWREGGWSEIAMAAVPGVVGRVLAIWIAIAGLVSALALFNALLLCYSRIVLVMAVDGFLPRALTTTDARGTPRNAVLFSALFYSVFALLRFGDLVIADVLLYAIALAMEFGALLYLRRREPELRGVFRIPLGNRGVTVLAFLPATVLGLVIILAFRDGEYGVTAVLGSAVGIAAGPLLYWLAMRQRRS